MPRKKSQDDTQPRKRSKDARELHEQRRNAVKFKIDMVDEAGGVLDVEEVRALLNIPSVDAVQNAVRQRRLLAVEDNDRLWFPNCQFAGGQVLPGIQAILKAIPETNGWRILQYLYGSDDGLAGNRPIDLVKGSVVDIDRVVRFARILES